MTQANQSPTPSLLTGLITRAATVTEFNADRHKSKKAQLQDRIRSELANELDNMDLSLRFTEMLVDAGHPNPAQWLVDALKEFPITGEKTWRQQIRQFSRRWITYLTELHSEEIDTMKLRMVLAREANPIEWIGQLDHSLVPFIMQHKLFMSATQAQALTDSEHEVQTYEITPDGPKRVENDSSILTALGQAEEP